MREKETRFLGSRRLLSWLLAMLLLAGVLPVNTLGQEAATCLSLVTAIRAVGEDGEL